MSDATDFLGATAEHDSGQQPATPAKQSDADQFLHGQVAEIRNNVYNAVPQNPAQVAQHAQIARLLGVPVESVAEDPARAKQQAAMQAFDAQKVVTQYPHLAQFLSDPTNAAKSHNDLPTLAATEAAVKSMPQPSPASAPPDLNPEPSGAKDWIDTNLKSVPTLPETFAKGVASSFVGAGRAVNWMLGGFPSAYDLAAGVMTGKPSTAAHDAWVKNFIEPLDRDRTLLAPVPDDTFMQKLTHGGGDLVGMLAQIAMTGGMSQAPAVADAATPVLTKVADAVQHAARSMAFPSLTTAVNTGNDVYDKTGSVAAAVKAAITAYGTTTAAGVLPLSLEGNLATRVATGFPVGALAGEANRQVMNAAMPTEMRTPPSVENTIIAGLTGSILAGVMGHPPAPHEVAIRDAQARAQSAQEAVMGVQTLHAIGDLAKQSELRKNDSGAFHDFVEQITDDGHAPKEVWIDGKTFVDALNQSGVQLEELQQKMPGIADQLHEALESRGGLKISTADFATSIAGGPLEQAIVPHLKVDPDGMTFKEGQDHLANQQTEMTDQANQLATEKVTRDERQQQLKAITDDVQGQLDATGRYPRDVSKQYAALHGAFYDTMSERAGLTPAKMRERFPMPIRSEGLLAGYDQGTIQVDGQERPTINASGRPIAGSEDALRNFWRWYSDSHGRILTHGIPEGAEGTSAGRASVDGRGGSDLDALQRPGDVGTDPRVPVKVGNISFQGTTGPVREGGQPVVFYHGTRDDITAFDTDHPNRKDKGWLGRGVYGSDSEDLGAIYANQKRGDHGENVMPLYMAVRNPYVADVALRKTLRNSSQEQIDAFTAKLKEIGYDGVALEHGDGTVELVAFENTQVKSVNNRGTFDPADPNILQQDARGSFIPSTGELILHKDANLSTFLHESGHFFLEALHNLASMPGAPEGVKADFDTLLRHFKVEGDTPEERLANWTARDLNAKREGHENFAEGFENYLMKGEAPVPELQSLFSRFRSWLMSIYQSVRGDVSPEVRGVMDRMLASEQAIEQAEKVRAYATADLTAEHGPLVDAYKDLGREATEQAISDMQARSLRDMQWMANAKGKALRDLQRTARDERAKIADEVTKEVMAEPVNQARKWLTKGEMTDGDGNLVKAEKGFRLNTGDLEAIFPKGELGRPDLSGLKGMTAKDGLHPDMVADMFGFDSGRTLIDGLLKSEKPQVTIDALTDQRMLERHGELTDPVSIERAAEAAIHNEARAKMMATGLKILTKSPMPVVDINRAAKAAADAAIAKKVVNDLRPAQYSAAETRANKDVLKLAPKDPAGAAQAQRAALLNNRLFKSATEAVDDVKRGQVDVKRMLRVSNLKKMAPDERALLLDAAAQYDFRENPSDEPTRAQKNLQQWLDAQTAAGYMPTVSPDLLTPRPATHYRDLTVEQFRGVVDSLRSLEHQGKSANYLDILGEKIDRREYIDTRLIPKIQAAGEHYTASEILDHPENRDLNPFTSALSKAGSWVTSAHESTLPPVHRADILDRHEVLGPFHESVFNPMFDAGVKEAKLNKAVTDYTTAAAKSLGKDWQKSRLERVPNDVLLDNKATEWEGKPVYLKITRDNLVAMLVHSGNESNFDKMVKGWGWDPATVTKFINDNITAKDLEGAEHIWHIASMHWDEQVAQARRLGAIVPPKIEARPFTTPVGEASGGYAPLRYDPSRSRQGEKAEQAAEVKANDNLRSAGSYMDRQSTIAGSLHSRNDGYIDVVDLRLSRLQDAIHEDIHDLAFREPIINTNKILNDSAFRKEFMKAYGREEYRAITTWVDQFVNSAQADKTATWLDSLLRYSRGGLVANAIGFRGTVIEKHGMSAALKSVGSFIGGGEGYFLKRLALVMTDHNNQVSSAMEKFGEIYTRSLQFDRDYRASLGSLLEPESFKGMLHRYGHFAVAYFDLLTAVPTAHAAYDRAISEGIPVRQGGTGKPMTDSEARAYASNVVRAAHGGSTDVTRSNLMNSKREGVKLFTTMYQFMNNSYGQMASTLGALRNPDIGKPEVLARAAMQLIVPGIIAAMIKEGMPEKDKLLAWLGRAVADESVGMLPGGAIALSIAQSMPHAGQVAPAALFDAEAQLVRDGIRIAQGKEAHKPIQNLGNAIGIAFQYSGAGQVGKTLQYLYDVKHGKENPTGPIDAVVSAINGPRHHNR